MGGCGCGCECGCGCGCGRGRGRVDVDVDESTLQSWLEDRISVVQCPLGLLPTYYYYYYRSNSWRAGDSGILFCSVLSSMFCSDDILPFLSDLIPSYPISQKSILNS